MDLPDSSVGKESTCNAGEPSSIPGLGRSTGEGTGYPFQYSWASLVTQLVQNLPAMWETWVWSMDWKDTLEKGNLYFSRPLQHSSILAWRIPWTVQCIGSQRVWHDWEPFTFTGKTGQLYVKEWKLEHSSTQYPKINSKWIKDLNVRPDIVKLLEENTSAMLFDINYSNIF